MSTTAGAVLISQGSEVLNSGLAEELRESRTFSLTKLYMHVDPVKVWARARPLVRQPFLPLLSLFTRRQNEPR